MKHQKRLALAPRAMERCWSRVGVGAVFMYAKVVVLLFCIRCLSI